MSRDIYGYSLRATPVLRTDGNLVAVDACTADGRQLSVVWERDGTGYPVLDQLDDAESDVVWFAVEKEMVANGLWS